MVRCAAFRCRNSSNDCVPGITFYRFPKEEKIRELWIEALTRKNWEPTRHSRICSAHFEDRYKTKTSRCHNLLSPDAIPTIFPSPTDEESEESCASVKQEDTASDTEPVPQTMQVIQLSYQRVPTEVTDLERRIDKMTQRCAEQHKKIRVLQIEGKRDEEKLSDMKRIVSKMQPKRRKRKKKENDTEEQFQVVVVYD